MSIWDTDPLQHSTEQQSDPPEDCDNWTLLFLEIPFRFKLKGTKRIKRERYDIWFTNTPPLNAVSPI